MSNDDEKSNPFAASDQTHEDMLKKYLEYYQLWDNWVQKRSVRSYYRAQRVSRELFHLMKAHNKTLSTDFYRVKRPNVNK